MERLKKDSTYAFGTRKSRTQSRIYFEYAFLLFAKAFLAVARFFDVSPNLPAKFCIFGNSTGTILGKKNCVQDWGLNPRPIA